MQPITGMGPGPALLGPQGTLNLGAPTIPPRTDCVELGTSYLVALASPLSWEHLQSSHSHTLPC